MRIFLCFGGFGCRSYVKPLTPDLCCKYQKNEKIKQNVLAHDDIFSIHAVLEKGLKKDLKPANLKL